MTTAELKQKDGVILVGHRGYAALYPENTMVSYEAAAKAGLQRAWTGGRFYSAGAAAVGLRYESRTGLCR